MMIPGQRESLRRPETQSVGPTATPAGDLPVAVAAAPRPAAIAAPSVPWSELPTWLEVSILMAGLVLVMLLAMWTAGR